MDNDQPGLSSRKAFSRVYSRLYYIWLDWPYFQEKKHNAKTDGIAFKGISSCFCVWSSSVGLRFIPCLCSTALITPLNPTCEAAFFLYYFGVKPSTRVCMMRCSCWEIRESIGIGFPAKDICRIRYIIWLQMSAGHRHHEEVMFDLSIIIPEAMCCSPAGHFKNG